MYLWVRKRKKLYYSIFQEEHMSQHSKEEQEEQWAIRAIINIKPIVLTVIIGMQVNSPLQQCTALIISTMGCFLKSRCSHCFVNPYLTASHDLL